MVTRKMKTANCPMIKVPALLQAWLVFFIVLFSQSLWANFIPDAAALTALNVLVDDVDDENVAKYIDAFLKHPETTEELLSRGNIYLPLIEKELTIQGLPSALKVLPLHRRPRRWAWVRPRRTGPLRAHRACWRRTARTSVPD